MSELPSHSGLIKNLSSSSIEVVDEFSYQETTLSDGELQKGAQCRIGKAARGFGCFMLHALTSF